MLLMCIWKRLIYYRKCHEVHAYDYLSDSMIIMTCDWELDTCHGFIINTMLRIKGKREGEYILYKWVQITSPFVYIIYRGTTYMRFLPVL